MTEYLPEIQAQLNGGATQGEDCGVRSTSTAIDWATDGKRVPGVKTLRERMGAPTGPTTEAQQLRGILTYDTPQETNGYTDLSATRKQDEGNAKLREWITQGKMVILSIDYGTINARRPDLSGDTRFMGGHSIAVMGQRTRDGQVQWRVWDSLCDGRRAGIPKGPNWWPRALLERAAEDYCLSGISGGGFSGVLMRKARPIEEPEPTPPPEPEPPTKDEIIADLTKKLAAAEADNEALDKALEESEARATAAVGVLTGETAAQIAAAAADPVTTGQVPST